MEAPNVGVTMQTEYTKGKCLNCDKEFWYVRYRKDKSFCKTQCQNRYYYVHKGTYSERERRKPPMSAAEWREHKREYDRQRLRDPAIRAAHNERNRRKYRTPEYRAYSLARYHRSAGGYHTRVHVRHGYTGHRWFDLVRKVVGNPPSEDSVYFDKWADRMGAGVLALLEGRDVAEAVKEHNRKEYIPNNKQVYISDWQGENEYKQGQIGTSPSAEEEATAKLDIAPLRKTPYSHGKNRRATNRGQPHHGRTAPTRRSTFREWQDRPGNRRD